MSSRRFVVELEPDALSRKIVLLCAAAALMTGLALLIRLPLPMPVRLLLSALYVASSVREIGRLSRGFARVRIIRLMAGESSIVNRQGRQEPVRIMSGSVVLPRVAWLRLRCSDGLACAELLRGDAGHSDQWRRLQILWRQGPGTFGGRD